MCNARSPSGGPAAWNFLRATRRWSTLVHSWSSRVSRHNRLTCNELREAVHLVQPNHTISRKEKEMKT